MVEDAGSIATPVADRHLRAAEYFLDKLKEVRRTPRSGEFGHNLGAFLNAARSATIGLQNDNKPRYDERFPRWQAENRDDAAFLKAMNDKRVEEAKQKGSEVATTGESVKLGFSVQAPDGSFMPIPNLFGPETVAYGLSPKHQWNVDGQAVEVIASCERYLAVVKEIFRRVRG